MRASAPTDLFFVAGDEFLDDLASDESGYGAAERVAAARRARAV